MLISIASIVFGSPTPKPTMFYIVVSVLLHSYLEDHFLIGDLGVSKLEDQVTHSVFSGMSSGQAGSKVHPEGMKGLLLKIRCRVKGQNLKENK